MGGREHPHVHLARHAFAEPADLSFLEHAQQHPLSGERQVADLVEEHRAAVGRFEDTLAIAVRAREGAARVAEQIRKEQRFGKRRAVDRHERRAARASRGGAGGPPAPCRCRSRRGSGPEDRPERAGPYDRSPRAGPGSRPPSSARIDHGAGLAEPLPLRSVSSVVPAPVGLVEDQGDDLPGAAVPGLQALGGRESAILRKVSIASRRHGAGAEPGTRRSASKTSRAAR